MPKRSRALVQTSLWGIDSHGIARLGHYLARIRAGSIAPRTALRITSTGPCTATMDGGHGLGIVVCTAAMEHAIELAQSNGVGIVGIGESSHCGAIGLYTRQAAAAGLIGFAFTHADSIVAPPAARRNCSAPIRCRSRFRMPTARRSASTWRPARFRGTV